MAGSAGATFVSLEVNSSERMMSRRTAGTAKALAQDAPVVIEAVEIGVAAENLAERRLDEGRVALKGGAPSRFQTFEEPSHAFVA